MPGTSCQWKFLNTSQLNHLVSIDIKNLFSRKKQKGKRSYTILASFLTYIKTWIYSQFFYKKIANMLKSIFSFSLSFTFLSPEMLFDKLLSLNSTNQRMGKRERERESILPINKPNGMVFIQQDGKIILYESPLTKGFFSHWIGNQKNVDIRKQSYQSAESKSTHQQYHQMYLFYPFGFHFFPPLRILSWIWTEITAIWSEQ